MDEELKKVVEAILFAAGRKIELSEIAKLARKPEAEILTILNELKLQLETTNSPTMLVQEGTTWKLTVKEKYISVIKKVVTKTDLPKSILETLAVVAYKAPVLQSKVIKIRTNKAYDHLSNLENSGLITREKSGRTKLIKLTPKFYEYFDIDPRKLKEKFTNTKEIEQAIEQKEKEATDIEEDRRKQTEERLEKPKIVLHGEQGTQQLETYEGAQPVQELMPTGVEVFMEKMGNLDVYDVPLESLPLEERAALEAQEHPHYKHHKKKGKHPHETHHKPAAPHAPREPHVPRPPKEPKQPAQVDAAAEQAKKVEEAAAKVEEELKTDKPEEKPELTPVQKIQEEAAQKASKLKERKFETQGITVTPEMETEIERKLKRILSGEEEKKDETPPPM